MDKKSKVVSNKRQLARLVQILQENQDIAKGICVKTRAKPRWETFAVELNSLGPPLRSWEKWLKVWTDLKSKTKKKLSENRSEFRSTGGGPNKLNVLTPLEEAVVRFLNYDICVNPPGEEIGSSSSMAQYEEIAEQDSFTSNTMETTIEESFATAEVQEQPRLSRQARTNSASKLKRFALLEKQVEMQANHFELQAKNTKDIRDSLRYIESFARRSFKLKEEKLNLGKEKLKLKKEKLKLLKEELLNKSKNRVDKLRLKVQLLELQKENVSSLVG